MPSANDPHDTEQTVDGLEEKIFGHTIDAGYEKPSEKPEDDALPDDGEAGEPTG